TVTALPNPLYYIDGPICFEETIHFTASGGLQYNSSGPGGFSTNLQNPVIPFVNLSANGLYTLIVTTGPCVVTHTVPLTIYSLPSPTVTSNMPVCEGKQLSLSVNTNSITTFIWQGPDNFLSSDPNTGIDSAL